jgi:hypothetical protein
LAVVGMDKTTLGLERRRLLGHGLGLGAALGSLHALGGCAAIARGDDPPPDHLAHTEVRPFSGGGIGDRPDGWYSYALRRDLPQTRYQLVRDSGRAVLHARATAAATGLRCPVRIDTRPQPLLQFSWRVDQVPGHATVDTPERDDCPARVIVAFDGDPARLPLRDRLFFEQVELFTGQRLPFAMLMYVWDGGLPTDSLTHNHRTKRIQYLTVDSGAAHVGQWRQHQRDVVADYQRAFGEAPGDIVSVGVLTDSDALKLDLQAWYGDISLRPRQG